ncbi:MAG: O-antigen ligase family protein [Chloroflexi bacterium]|nr:O-antigen ligase family protein [Chloroflexota bacterium]
MTSEYSALTRRLALERLSSLEPLLLLALAPFLWFPRPWSGLLLLLVPLLWALRRVVRGYLSVRTPYDVPAVCLVLLLPLTLLPVVDWTFAAPKLYGLLLGLALAYALANALGTPEQALLAVYATVLALGGGLAAVGLVGTEWMMHKLLPLGPLYERLPVLVRGVVYGTDQGGIHPNEVGGALALLVPLAVALLAGGLGRPRTRARGLLAAGLAATGGLMAIVLLLTQSRSAYAGCGIGLLLLLAWRLVAVPRSRRAQALGAAVVALAAVAGGWLAWRLATQWIAAAGTGLDTFTGRLELWDRAVSMLQDFPYTGIGMGQFSLVLHALYVPFLIAPDTYVPHAHNFFLQLGLDLGIPGALAVLGLLLAFFRALWQVYRRTDDAALRAAAVGLGAGMASFLTYGLTDAIALGARGGLGLWIVLGLGAALVRATPSGATPPARRPPSVARPGAG